MIRPCVAPIKPKTLKESELSFEQPFASTCANGFSTAPVVSPKRSIQQNASHYNSIPITLLIDSERTGRIFQRSEPRSEKMMIKLKQHAEKLVQSVVKDNKQEFKSIKKEMSELRSSICQLTERVKLCSEEDLKRMVSAVVHSQVQGKKLISLKEGIKLQSKFSVIEEKVLIAQKYYAQNLEKAYMEIKKVTNCMEDLSQKLENMEQQSLDRLVGVEERLRAIENRKQQVSKISLIEPQSIISGYQQSKSQLKEEISEIKQYSVIKKLGEIQDANSQMIIVSEDGSVTDIKGLPLIDSTGNMVVIDLKLFKKMLDKEDEQPATY